MIDVIDLTRTRCSLTKGCRENWLCNKGESEGMICKPAMWEERENVRVQLVGRVHRFGCSCWTFVLRDEMFVVDASVACGYVLGADCDSVAGFDVAVGVVSVGSDVGGCEGCENWFWGCECWF